MVALKRSVCRVAALGCSLASILVTSGRKPISSSWSASSKTKVLRLTQRASMPGEGEGEGEGEG
jgi:hypothetical protein